MQLEKTYQKLDFEKDVLLNKIQGAQTSRVQKLCQGHQCLQFTIVLFSGSHRRY